MGDTTLGPVALRELVHEAPSREADSDPVDDCELALLGSTGRLLAEVLGARNLFVMPPDRFLAGEGVPAGDGDTTPGELAAAMLGNGADSSSLSASSPEPLGEMNLAVWRGPDEDVPLDFFKMGVGGGGCEALDDVLFCDEALALGTDGPWCSRGPEAAAWVPTADEITWRMEGGTCDDKVNG